MARIRVATTIAAPSNHVWADVADISSHVEWMVDATAIRFVGTARSGVGTAFDCDTAIGPFRLTDRMEITEWEPGRAMGVRHVGIVTGEGRFTLSRRPFRRTRFTWDEQLTAPWWLGGPVTAWLAAPVLAVVWRRNLRHLAARFEGWAQPTGTRRTRASTASRRDETRWGKSS